jgi:hypothetical protein
VVESTALEMRHTGNRIGGSNPSLSATKVPDIFIFLSSAGCEFLRIFRGFAARALTVLFAQRRIFEDRRRLRRRVSVAPPWWYGSLLQSRHFQDQAEHANERVSNRR